MVGSAIVRKLQDVGEYALITRTHAELDLINQAAVRKFLQAERPDVVIIAAAKVGGIKRTRPTPQILYENLMMECNVIHQAFDAGITRLLHLGSSCITLRAHLSPWLKMPFSLAR